LARLWYLPSVLVLLAITLGPLGVQLGVLGSIQGWGLFSAGLVFALLSLPVTAGGAALASALGWPWRGSAVRGAIVPLLVVATLVLPNGRKLEPRIHDITTDPEDSLQFRPDVAAYRPAEEENRQMPREQVLALAREAYPDVDPVRLDAPPERAFELATATAAAMPGWQIVHTDTRERRLEIEVTSSVFRFVDDVVIRVQPQPGEAGARVDVRSRSRVGQSDLGANAARIRAFSEALKRRAAS